MIIYTFKTESINQAKIKQIIQNTFEELKTTIWINLIELESEFHQQGITLNKRLAVNTTNEYSEKSTYLSMCNKIIEELKNIRTIPDKISWEYIQFSKQGVSRQSKLIKEFKPQLNKRNKIEDTPISELISDNYKIYFEIKPFPLK